MGNPFVCNTMIRAYSNNVFLVKAMLRYNYLNSVHIECDHFTYNFLFKACGRIIWCTKDDSRAVKLIDIAFKGAEIHGRI